VINIYLFCVILLVNIIIFSNLNLISKAVNLYDFPNSSRKIHTAPTPSIGGLILLTNLTFLLLINFFFNVFIFNFFVLFYFSIAIFFISFLDDKFNISPYKKFFFIGLVVFLFFLNNEEQLINRVVFDFYYMSIENYYLSFFISWICVMLFLNAVNLYDGANGQLATYFIAIFLFFLYRNIFFSLSFFILIFLLFFLYYNLRGKIFLGDNGSFLLGFVVAFMFISNNSTENYIVAERVFLLMFLPGLDMLRLFVERLLNKKNPFIADKSHIHHLLIKKFSEKQRNVFNILIFSAPIILSYLINNLFLISVLIIFYFLFIYKYLGHSLKNND